MLSHVKQEMTQSMTRHVLGKKRKWNQAFKVRCKILLHRPLIPFLLYFYNIALILW